MLGLQFHLLPIRDWNSCSMIASKSSLDCNFTYSLLGIETLDIISSQCFKELQFHLLPIRDWNLITLQQ